MNVLHRLMAPAVLAVVALGACSDDPVTPKPTYPETVAAAAKSANSVDVTWAAFDGATSYIIQRSTGTGAFAQVGTSTTTTFSDAGLQPATAYSYKVAAVTASETTPFAPAISVTTKAAGTAAITLTGNITASRTLYADTVYTLSGYVKVRSPATLTIQAGTKIVGDVAVAGSSLWITRGAKINAIGTAAAPIVFTSARNVNDRAPGDWGGIIIVGNAVVNRSFSGGVATIATEGPTGTGQNTGENYAGGTDPNDNSGTMRYVRIEFAGYAVVANQELNALSMYAVGRGTTIEFVQALMGLDDSFEWFGGSVDTRYLVSYEAGDDHFDWTEGYNGRNQFLIGLQTFQPTPRADAGLVSTDPHGFEGDGCEIDKAGCTSFTIAPLSMPVFANFTLVGTGPGVMQNVSDANGWVVRRGSGGTFLNGVMARWQGFGLNVRDAATDAGRQVDSLLISGVLLNENAGGNYDAGGTTFGTAANFPNTQSTTVNTSTLFVGLPAPGATPTVTALDWTPAAGSALTSGGTTTLPAKAAARVNSYFGGTMPATVYRGAADPAGTKWWQGWTSYARN